MTSSAPAAAPSERKRVVIVGAGLAGLSAADKLTAYPGAEVLLLESSARVGGRNGSVYLQSSPSTVVDIGGQWLGHKQEAAKELARDLGIPLIPQFNTGKRVVQLGSDIRAYKGLIPNVSWGVLVDAQLAITMVKIVQFLVWLLPLSCCLQRWFDRCTMEGLSNRLMWTNGGKALLRIIIRAFLGVEPANISVLAFAREINASDSVENMSETGPGSLQMATLQGGAQQLSARLADRVLSRGTTILFEHRVVSISRGEALASSPTSSSSSAAASTTSKPISIRCENGATIEADYVVLCCAGPVISKYVTFSPPLSAPRATLMQQSKMGSIIKAIIVFRRAFWRDAGFSGEAICDVDSDPNRGPCFNLFDGSVPVGSKPPSAATATSQVLPAEKRMATPSNTYVDPEVQAWNAAQSAASSSTSSTSGEDAFPGTQFIVGKHPVTGAEGARFVPTLVAFINGQTASESSKRVSFDDRRAAVLRQIGAWFKCPEEALRPLEYIEMDWVANPHSIGCPNVSYAAGVLEAFGTHRDLAEPEWREPVRGKVAGQFLSRLHFSGTETSEISTGFMCGAIRSGHRAAAELIADIGAELRAERARGDAGSVRYSHTSVTASPTSSANGFSDVSVAVVSTESHDRELGSPLLSSAL